MAVDVPASQLEPVAENVWAVSAPLALLGTFHVGTRMTVVRLSNGDVLLHSPVTMSPELAEQVGAIGRVRHIVCPNRYLITHDPQPF